MAEATPSVTPVTPAPAGNTSTPTPAPVVSSDSATPASTDAAPAATTPTDAPTPATSQPSAEPAKAGATPLDPSAPLFTVPEDMTLAPEALSKFEGSIKAKLNAAGKAELSPQEVVDLFVDQARDAAALWQKQVTAQDKAWEQESKARFTPAQLAAGETGVGWLASLDPQFRDLAKQFKNNPAFVNAMRAIGERLSEDTLEVGGASPAPAKRSAASILYGKPGN